MPKILVFKGAKLCSSIFEENFFEFLQNDFLGVILCEKSIARIPEA
jgi:hypothetical protein